MGRGGMHDGVPDRQALAAQIRQKHVRDSGLRRFITVAFIVLVAVASLGALAWMQLQGDDDAAAVETPEHASENYGFVLTPDLATGSESDSEGLIAVEIYDDFLCDTCQIFHEESGEYLTEQLEAGVISIEYHPFAFLITESTDEYSQRAANAAVCVADEAGVVAYAEMHDLLLNNQPSASGPGLTDDELLAYAAQAGAEDIDACVEDRTFAPWLEAALEAGLDADVSATPTVRVDGLNVVRSVDGNESMPGPEELKYAIEELS